VTNDNIKVNIISMEHTLLPTQVVRKCSVPCNTPVFIVVSLEDSVLVTGPVKIVFRNAWKGVNVSEGSAACLYFVEPL
jgi:hypothetical protein